MRKSVLSLSIAAALAVPALATAQQAAAPAAPAAPTLDKVLEASGVAVTGYIDTAYTHANRDIQNGFSTRVFDTQNNSFNLHQVGLQLAKQPKQGVGGLVNVTAGSDARVIHSAPEGAGGSTFDLTQGFLQYATGALTVIGGKFTTLHGTEVIWSPSNANYSRSILFGSVPFTHTGVRATYSFGDALSLIGGLNNGWDQMTDLNKDKTLELGLTSNPIKPLTIAASYYGGKEPNVALNTNGRRESFNFVLGYTVFEPLTVGFEYLTVKQKEGVSDGAGGAKDGKYSGIAAYLGYAITPKLKTSLRVESFNDKDGLRFPTAATAAGTNGTKHSELTLTVGYAMADNLDVRGEVRSDRSNEAVYTDGANMSKSLTTFAIQGLYKF